MKHVQFLCLVGAILAVLAPFTKARQHPISWGDDSFGQVSNTPGAYVLTEVAGGGFHSLALRPDGSIFSWGRDNVSQVGSTPPGTGFIQVAGGFDHSLALRSNGSIVSWGSDGFGQVSSTPGGTGFVQVAGGWAHSLALDSSGSIVSWGLDNIGQVSNTPPGTGFVQVAGGGFHSVALRSDGSIVSWGQDTQGQILGTPSGRGFVQAAAGGYHSLALRSDGSIVSWGDDYHGGVTNTPSGACFVQVAGGTDFSVARRSDGSIVSWGRDLEGQVTGTPSGRSFAQVAAGHVHLLALTGPLPPPPSFVAYCRAGTTNSGCTPTIQASGTPSLTNAGAFTLSVSAMEGNRNGIFFYSIQGRRRVAWGNSTSYLCLKSPTQRMSPSASSGGTNGQCNGTLSRDWNAYVAANPNSPINQALLAGTKVGAQAWSRDPGSGTGPVGSRGTSLSAALEFSVCP